MLQSSMQNSLSEATEKAFASMFGEERHGWVRCYVKTMTPSLLKRNQEVIVVQKVVIFNLETWKTRLKV